jgi:hypothetical protein
MVIVGGKVIITDAPIGYLKDIIAHEYDVGEYEAW